MNEFHGGPQGVAAANNALPPISARALAEKWPIFSEAVLSRLHAGATAYGDGSFAKSPLELVGEVEQEILDQMGWAFILWVRLHKLAESFSPALALQQRENAAAEQDIPRQDH